MSLHASILNVKPELRPIHKMSIYSTRDGYTIIGFDRKKTAYNILKVKKGTPMNPNEEINLYRLITDEGKARSKEEIAAYLRMKKDELRFACKAYAIMGFIKLLQGYYMLAVTEAECVAKIGSHKIYKVNFVSYIPLFDEVPSSTTKKLEKRCLQCLKTFDLTSGFYFSDTYDLTNTFQTNIYAMSNNDPDFFTKRAYTPSNCQPIRNFNECFMWNYYLSKEFSNAIVNPRWIKGFIYGYLEQAKVQKGIISFQIVLIARRCRHHAGTRYLTRGINPEGFVGNFVEVEQIVLDLTNGTMYNPLCTSFVQVRGSVPVYWFQETRVYEPKPPIHMNPAADILFQATKKHFADLYSLYGPQIFVLNLVKKQNKREELLTAEFQNAIEYLNRDIPNDLKITYYHQDMKALLKRDREEFLSTTSAFAKIAIEKLGFFCAKIDPLDKHITPISFQAGVIRSNCVDCLDRTNTFQQLVGEVALSMQIAKLYENEKMKFHNPAEFLEDTLLKYFRGMYGRMGDLISLQYGGSIAHKPNIGTKESKKFEFLTSIKRYYSNTFMDQDRQNAINLFLGIYQPKLDGPPVWEMVSPIILAPNHKYLSQVLSSEKWWEKPLETWRNTLYHTPPTPQNANAKHSRRSSFDQFANKLPTESLLMSFPSMRLAVNDTDSHVEENKWEFSVEESDTTSRGSFFNPPRHYLTHSLRQLENSLSIDRSKSVSPDSEGLFVDEKKISSLEKKFKKIYNQVLILDDKEEQHEEDKKEKVKQDHSHRRRSTRNNSSYVRQLKLDPEEKALYKDYCAVQNMNADELFEKEDLSAKLEEEMKLGFTEADIKKEFEQYFDLESKLEYKESFPHRITDYAEDELKDHVGRPLNDLFIEDLEFNEENTVTWNKETKAKGPVSNKKLNLGSLKNMLTVIFPHLQRPNIMKV